MSVLRLARSEWLAFWTGGAGGLSALVFLVLSGLWLYNAAVDYSAMNMGAMARGRALDAGPALFSGPLAQLGLLLMLVAPIATMRPFAVFARGGHLDLLTAWPLTRWEIILGCFLASAASLSLLAVLSLAPYAALILLGVGGAKLLLCSLIGLLLLISAFTAVGLAVSSYSETPLGSALATLGALGVFWALGWAAPYLPEGPAALAQGLAFAPRLAHFTFGLIDLNDVAYFLCLTAAGLFAARPFSD
jgi:ABC-2 type transport system permease protein